MLNLKSCRKCSMLVGPAYRDIFCPDGRLKCRGVKNGEATIYTFTREDSPPVWCPHKLEHGIAEVIHAK